VSFGPTLVYVTADGRYLIQGDVLDVKEKRNLTEAHRAERRKQILSSLDDNELIIFKPEQPTHAVTVFTDIDCGYCRKFHQEIADFNKLGIEVRYAAFPRAGIGSPSFNMAVSVWCADDRNRAITRAKAGDKVDEKTCDNPVAAEYTLGQQLGVTGTPSIILEDGTLVPGYVPAARLKQMLDQGAG
jgi:thiol:disulfide interchange protein DsbC